MAMNQARDAEDQNQGKGSGIEGREYISNNYHEAEWT